MTATSTPTHSGVVSGLPRLLPPTHESLSLEAHQLRYGPLPPMSGDFVAWVEHSGLRGRGGAGFPTARKLAAVAQRAGRRGSVVVANGSESEPASGKDRILMTLAPHLVLDGVAVAAAAVGATEAIVCVDRMAGSAARALTAALAERRDPVPVRLASVPHRYVSGEETALLSLLNGGTGLPSFVPPRPFERGVQDRPTLVDNVETLANLALIARFGGAWFRGVGTAATPGSMLVTLSGAVARPGVIEAACGTSVESLLAIAGGPTEPLSALLLGGYFGSWETPEAARARTLDLSIGAGVIVAFPASACGLVEVARLARWLAQQSAGQCGPCSNGLPAIAHDVEALAQGWAAPQVVANLQRHLAVVLGRGACHLPDGASHVIASGLNTFASEIDAHRGGRCTARSQAPVLPAPATDPI